MTCDAALSTIASDHLSLAGTVSVCLIGGGELMLDAARILIRHGIKCDAILAPRHAREVVSDDATLVDLLCSAGIGTMIVPDINAEVDRIGDRTSRLNGLALCLGPAWIFSPQVRSVFGKGMINLNAIPIPRYLGGAHYSWQILNGDRKGGCFLQEITGAIDKGPILHSYTFQIPDTARVPEDYFSAYSAAAGQCLEHLAVTIIDGGAYVRNEFSAVDPQRLYFPRLLTAQHGFIDWSWSVEAIERFCNAFDRPYAGAMTFANGRMMHLRDVRLASINCDSHPLTAGLVIRHTADQLIVAAKGGGLFVAAIHDDEGEDMKPFLREGMRLVTPQNLLASALQFRPRLTADGFQL